MLVGARIGGEHAWGVSEQHEMLGVDQVGHQRGDAIVVAEANFVVGYGVVLVDHRHHAQFEQALHGAARVHVLRAHDEVEGREEHLAPDEPMACQFVHVVPDEAPLAHGRHRLQRRNVARAAIATETEQRQASGDGSRRHDHASMPGVPQRSDLTAELGDRVGRNGTGVIRDRRRADLRDDGRAHHSSSYSKLKSPMWTTSPMRTPARTSARFTPIFFNRARM